MADGIATAVRVGEARNANAIHHVAERRGRAALEVTVTGPPRDIGARIRAATRTARTRAAGRRVTPAGAGAGGAAAAAGGSGSAAPASARSAHASGTSRL